MGIPVTCICGHPIDADEVVQMGAYTRLSGPNVVYVRFRCSVCNHLGEKLVEQQSNYITPPYLRQQPLL